MIVQLVVAGPCVLEDAHRQPVLVEVVVKWDGEHDRHDLIALRASHVKQLVGQDANGARGRVIVLGEGAHLCVGGAHSGLWRAVGKPSLHVHPVEKRKSRGFQTCYML